MNGKFDRVIAWTIESALVGSSIYATLTNRSAWTLVAITAIFTLFLLVVTDNKHR